MSFWKLTLYTQTLAVPHRRAWDTPELRQGEVLFTQLGCAVCHVKTLKTGDHPVPQLRHQTIHPFTDLLLHDMGPGLADEAEGAKEAFWKAPTADRAALVAFLRSLRGMVFIIK
jgi:CxxC motif-containing protein (DUF1111 family)